MSLEVPSGMDVFDPTYWEGFDLRTGQGNLRDRKMWKGDPHWLKKGAPILKSAIGEVLQGNYTEIRYGAGQEFDPDRNKIADGSLVVMDSEELTIWPHETEETAEVPPISQPYVSYWLENQPGARHLGQETSKSPDNALLYSRWLSWGVVSQSDVYYYESGIVPVPIKRRRVIYPISFDEIIHNDGDVRIPKWHRLKNWHHVLILPALIGNVEIHDHKRIDSKNKGEVTSIGRTRSVDLIYEAKADRKRRFSTSLGRLALPKTAGA
jgi:hypothetical protein